MKQSAVADIPQSSWVRQQAKKFAKSLLQWNKESNMRQMPWKGERDPYKIWLSEIILQQTRVDQGWEYYKRFVKKFPTIHQLAQAPELEVFKLWEGLGYYSRCKNLIATAKYIDEELKGFFPSDYASILQLKGVGPYTAAAIASFAYHLPYAVLDGNVFRVLARIFDLQVAIDTTEGKKLFSALAQQVLPKDHAAAYNQAIMDFGAVVCKPVPACHQCFFNTRCKAFLKGVEKKLPIKEKQLVVKERWFCYLILHHQGKYAIRKRTGTDIWQNLYEFLLVETGKATAAEELVQLAASTFGFKQGDVKASGNLISMQQRLSHQVIHFSFLPAELTRANALNGEFIWVTAEELENYPFPKSLKRIISTKNDMFNVTFRW